MNQMEITNKWTNKQKWNRLIEVVIQWWWNDEDGDGGKKIGIDSKEKGTLYLQWHNRNQMKR